MSAVSRILDSMCTQILAIRIRSRFLRFTREPVVLATAQVDANVTGGRDRKLRFPFTLFSINSDVRKHQDSRFRIELPSRLDLQWCGFIGDKIFEEVSRNRLPVVLNDNRIVGKFPGDVLFDVSELYVPQPIHCEWGVAAGCDRRTTTTAAGTTDEQETQDNLERDSRLTPYNRNNQHDSLSFLEKFRGVVWPIEIVNVMQL